VQAYGILATRSLFDGLRGSAFFEELDALYSDIRAVAHRPTRPSMRGEAPHDGRLEERLVVHVPMAKHYRDRAEQLDMVVEGLRDNCALHIRLVRPAPFDSAKVTLEPYALVTHQAEVHCIGRDVVTNQVRVLRLDEVAEVVVAAEQRFVLPQDFDVRAYLDGVCGVVAPGPRTEVLLEFDAQVAERIRHCRIHPTQRVAIARDGRMRISMAVSNLDALLSWLLGFGPQAKVVEPPAVADALRHRLEATLSRYAPRPA
jgi:predicted DNA-binding transcriptional regulator YafY